MNQAQVNFPDGYYPSEWLNELYNQARLTTTASGFAGAEVVYHLVHEHIDGDGVVHQSETDHVANEGGCYTVKGTFQSYEQTGTGSRSQCVHMKSTSCSGDLKGVYVGGGGCSKCDKWENVSYPIYGYVTRECYYIGCNHTWHDDEGSTTDYSSIQPYQAIKSVDVILIQ